MYQLSVSLSISISSAYAETVFSCTIKIGVDNCNNINISVLTDIIC